jgi:aminopeptidase YwaD
MVRLNYDILNGLCVDRSIGSDGEEHILEYIKKEVEDLGIQTVRERFPFCAAISERSELRFGKETLFCSAYPCTRDTGAVGVQGKLIYIPRISDAEDTSIKQAIILTESDFNERCKKLLVAGSAAGVITYKKGRSQHDMPACFLPQEPCSDLLTAIEICTTDAMRLLLSGVETVKIVMQSREQYFSTENLYALLPGQDHSQAIVICAHYDTVPLTTGAVDNLSGTLILLFLLEMLAGKTPKSDILFCWFGAEEWGCAGSRYFVNKAHNFTPQISCAINIDSADCILGFDELYYSCTNLQLLKRLLIPQTGLRALNQIYGGDNRPFQAIGVDTLTFSRGGKLIDALMHTKDDTLQNAGITDHSLRCAAQRILNIIYPIIFG